MPEFEKVNALLQEQRDAAYDHARRRIAGDEPERKDEPTPDAFQRNAFAKYPPEFIRNTRRIGYTVMIAAFVPSAIRLFVATFEATHYASFWIAIAIGGMSVLLAEVGQVAFTLWAATTEGVGLRRALRLAAWGCTAFALVGNGHIVQPWASGFLIAWLEAFLPPLLVLVAANVLKAQSLHEIENRYAAHQEYLNAWHAWDAAFATAFAAWRERYDAAPMQSAWDAELANALREALRQANRQSKAVLRQLTNAEWRALILRERKAEEWWQDAEADAARVEAERIALDDAQRLALTEAEALRLARRESLRSGSVSTAATGEIASVEMQRDGDAFVKVCPECGYRAIGTTPRSATNALVAHRKKHANAEAKSQADALPITTLEGDALVLNAFSANGHAESEDA